MAVKLKRAYDEPAAGDGYRVLVDRLWPRGISKDRAALDEWLKDAAPSTELRRWFHGDRRDWDEFVRRYRAELDGPAAPAVERLTRLCGEGDVTLVYAARDEDRNHARVLGDYLEEAIRGGIPGR